MRGASVRELGEERRDGGSHVSARIAARVQGGGGGGGGRRVRGGDGLLPGLGRSELVQQGLYAICVLAKMVRGTLAPA